MRHRDLRCPLIAFITGQGVATYVHITITIFVIPTLVFGTVIIYFDMPVCTYFRVMFFEGRASESLKYM